MKNHEKSPWIGETPKSWSQIPIKRTIISRDGGSWGDDKGKDDEDVICMRIADFDFANGVFKHLPEDAYTKRSYPARQVNKLTLRQGDILIEKSGGGEKTPVGRSVIYNLPYKALYANFMDRLRFDNTVINSEYAEYYLRAMYYKAVPVMYIKQTTGIQNLNLTAMLSDEKILLPPLSDQQGIVFFLNKICTEIDFAIDEAQKCICGYRDYRTNIISQSVTRGIKPDRPLVDSGLNWLPQIPEGWTPMPAKALFLLRNERARPDDEQLTASQKHGIIPQKKFMEIENQRVVIVEKDFSILKHVEPGDFVISMRSFQGGIEYSNERGCISSAYVMLIPNKKHVYEPYFKWLLKSDKYINALQSTSNLVRDGQALRYSNFAQVRLFVPPYGEQREIAEYLNRTVPQIDSMIEEKQSVIEWLEAYKRKLIFDYVTGKKEIESEGKSL